MPKTTTSGRPKPSELPDTLKKSPKKAQRQFAKTHDSAAEQYGEGERAHRAALATPNRSCTSARRTSTSAAGRR